MSVLLDKIENRFDMSRVLTAKNDAMMSKILVILCKDNLET
jgi:hypothetical protein